MALVSSQLPRRVEHPSDQKSYTPLQRYLLKRLAELQQRQRELPPEFQNHPIGRLTRAALNSTLEECHWAGVGSEAGWILQQSRGTASA